MGIELMWNLMVLKIYVHPHFWEDFYNLRTFLFQSGNTNLQLKTRGLVDRFFFKKLVKLPHHYLGFVFWVSFYGFYHGKSPSNHHLGNMFYFFSKHLKQANLSHHYQLPQSCNIKAFVLGSRFIAPVVSFFNVFV